VRDAGRLVRISAKSSRPAIWKSAGAQAGFPRLRPTDESVGPYSGAAFVAMRRAIDIRPLDRHPLATVGSLVIGLRCSMCRGAPLPVIRGLHAHPPAATYTSTLT
jgi:hypothetical protein